MNRATVLRYLLSRGDDRSLFVESAQEIEEYERCLSKTGASCHILMTGDERISISDVMDIVPVMIDAINGGVSTGGFDYIINGLLLDEMVNKSDDVVELLEELGSLTGDFADSEFRAQLLKELSRIGVRPETI